MERDSLFSDDKNSKPAQSDQTSPNSAVQKVVERTDPRASQPSPSVALERGVLSNDDTDSKPAQTSPNSTDPTVQKVELAVERRTDPPTSSPSGSGPPNLHDITRGVSGYILILGNDRPAFVLPPTDFLRPAQRWHSQAFSGDSQLGRDQAESLWWSGTLHDQGMRPGRPAIVGRPMVNEICQVLIGAQIA
jgi:hypothetical protein